MVGAVDWSNLTVAGAFILGAVLAALGTIRVVRAVATLFDEGPHRRPPWRRERPPEDPAGP